MDSTPPLDLGRFWEGRIRGVRRYVNLGWLVEAMLPVVFFVAVLGTIAILLARRQGWDAAGVGLGGLAVLGVAGGIATLRARRRFISAEEARTRVESGLRLHSRLSAAAAGVGPWPPPEHWRAGLWRWHWRRLAVLPLCSAALVVAALLFPMSPGREFVSAPIAKPPALEAVESMLEKLAATPEVEQTDVEALREEAERLAKLDPADWYSHAGLESADHLKAKLAAGLKALGEQTARLEQLLGPGAAEAGASWDEQLQGALSALQGNVPGLNSELAKALGELDRSKLSTLSPEQLSRLKEGLRRTQNAAGRKPGEGEGEGKSSGSGEGEGAEEGEGLGNGGLDRGPGTGPLKLGAPTDLATKKTEAAGSEDFSRAALGDAVGTSAGRHEVDENKSHRAADGGAAAAGEGAGAVWQQGNVTPEERKRLQQFFR